MVRYKQYSPFVILEFEAETWDYPLHNHNYFEIIFIGEGKGKHSINNISFPYKKGDVFLLSSEDYHAFVIEEKTKFCFFKFTELAFRKDKRDKEQRVWIERIEAVINTVNQLPGAIQFSELDKQLVGHLNRTILHEHYTPKCYSDNIISDCMSVLMSVIARNISYEYNGDIVINSNVNNSVNELLNYIRHNVYHATKITPDQLAKHFGYSKNYIGIMFKKQVGESLQNFILNYKLTLVENRVVNTNFNLKEIAFDLGFSDLSHLNKHFKRKYGMAPTRYRIHKRTLLEEHPGFNLQEV